MGYLAAGIPGLSQPDASCSGENNWDLGIMKIDQPTPRPTIGGIGVPRPPRRLSATRSPREFFRLAIIFTVFGFVLALVLAGYNPAVATGAAAACSLTASELARRVYRKDPERRRIEKSKEKK